MFACTADPVADEMRGVADAARPGVRGRVAARVDHADLAHGLAAVGREHLGQCLGGVRPSRISRSPLGPWRDLGERLRHDGADARLDPRDAAPDAEPAASARPRPARRSRGRRQRSSTSWGTSGTARAARLSIHHRSSRGEGSLTETAEEQQPAAGTEADETRQRGKTVHGEPANAGHRVLAPDDAEVEAYLEVALDAPAPERTPQDRPPAADVRRARDRRRPRLRQPVRPADRAPRPRAQRLLGAPAPRHADGRARAARRPGGHPVRRPDVGVRRRRPQARTPRSGAAGCRSSASATAPS